MKDIESIAELLSATLVPIIALVTVYIAWHQYRLNRYRVRLDLFNRRLKVFECVDSFLKSVISSASCDFSDIRKLRQGTAEARFLFGKEIPRYIDALVGHGSDLDTWNQKYAHPEYDHDKVVEGRSRERRWLTEQIDEAVTKFKKYLDMSRL